LLSCCLLDGADVISRCLEARIRPESFYLAAHGIVFERLLDLYNRQTPVDISVLAEDLKTIKQLDAVGGVRLPDADQQPDSHYGPSRILYR